MEDSEESLLVAPQAIVPLMVSREEAERSLAAWAKYAVEDRPLLIERLTAMYLPFWLFEMGGVVEWSLLQASAAWGGEDSPLSGSEARLSPIAVLASSNPHPGFVEAIEGIEPGLLVPFDPAYLAAHPAETYLVSMADAALRARQKALRATGAKLMAGAGGVRMNLRSAHMVVTSYRLALAPVWLAEVSTGEARRRLVVSGVTAAVHTEEG